MAPRWADRDAGPRPSLERLLTAACGTLAAYGYEPRRHADTVTLANCPFHALAGEHPELVCGMNLAPIEAVATRASDGRLTARRSPAPDRGCVVLTAERPPHSHHQGTGLSS